MVTKKGEQKRKGQITNMILKKMRNMIHQIDKQ